MDERITIINQDFPSEGPNGITFAGALRKYLFVKGEDGKNIGLSKDWDVVYERYIRDYNKRLLPLLPREKFLGDYTQDDFTEVLSYLAQHRDYAEGTLGHYGHLLWVVYRAGFKDGLYSDAIFWDDVYGEDEESVVLPENVDEEGRRLLRIKKSFTPKEERFLFTTLTTAARTDGEVMGLLLMLLCGLRNNEASGLDFGDIRPMQEYPEVSCIWVYKTAKRDSAERKGSGKTKNANRILPLITVAQTIIRDRKRYVQEQIDKGALVLDEGQTIEDLPIACIGDNLKARCSSAHLTRRGREFLKQLSQEPFDYAGINILLINIAEKDVQFEEKDPTTYLFRRNFATHLYTLGLDAPSIQYYIGHDVESMTARRNDFVNEEKLIQLKRILDKHPLNTSVSEYHEICSNTFYSFQDEDTIELLIPAGERGTVNMSALCAEPFDAAEIVCTSNGNNLLMHYNQHIEANRYTEQINIRSQLTKAYSQTE